MQVHDVPPSGELADREQVPEVLRCRLPSQVQRHVVGSGTFDPPRERPGIPAGARDGDGVPRGDGRLRQLPHAHGHTVGHRLRHDEDVEPSVFHGCDGTCGTGDIVLRTLALGYVEGRSRATVPDGRQASAPPLRSA